MKDPLSEFDDWNIIKKRISLKLHRAFYKEREIWWCSLGKNIGDEQDGKGPQKARPVLILRKFNRNIFIGLPLSTQLKNAAYYYKFDLKGEQQSIILSQVRLIDAKRLLSKIERIAEKQFYVIMSDFLKYVFNAQIIRPS